VNGARISIQKLSFGFAEKILFDNITLELGNENPTVILGPSGCGKTTLLKLIAGLLRPSRGTVTVEAAGGAAGPRTAEAPAPAVSFVFQEPRLLPWKTALANVSLPLAGLLGKAEAEKRGREYLRMVSLEEKADSFPPELSGGQRQRVNLARAFAFPSAAILMDEPFQSLDIPLRKQLMDLAAALLSESPRLLLVVTHDPRDAAYMGKRILVFGTPPAGVVFDRTTAFTGEDARYGCEAQGRLERELIRALAGN
jgi:NitT/TauT family transport system ATP-binding protein